MESLDDIFRSARAMGDLTERAVYLAQACGADAALRERVEALLRDAAGAKDFSALRIICPAGLWRH